MYINGEKEVKKIIMQAFFFIYDILTSQREAMTSTQKLSTIKLWKKLATIAVSNYL